MKRRLMLVVAFVVLGLAAVAIRVVREGRAALDEGDAAAAEERYDDAIAAWEQAARAYLPFAPHVDDAYARLVELAGQRRTYALPAWRAVRSAALATRTLWTPHADDLATANAQIAELASRDPAGASAGGSDAATRKTFHLERLAADARPGRGAATLMLVWVAAALAGLALVVRRADRRGA